MSVVTVGSPDSPGIPARNGFTAYFALSLAIGFLVTVAGGIASANLTPASRRQDHTTSPSASRAVRQQHVSVHRIPSRVRDDRDTPLEWDETGIAIFLFLPTRQAEIRKFRICSDMRGWPEQAVLRRLRGFRLRNARNQTAVRQREPPRGSG